MNFCCSHNLASDRYQLALDMGTAPSILQVASFGRVVFLTWALGPNFNTKFRLIGHWRWSGASQVMENELWNVIVRRRGWFRTKLRPARSDKVMLTSLQLGSFLASFP